MENHKRLSTFSDLHVHLHAAEWTEFIESHPESTPFHELGFLELMQTAPGSKAHLFIERRASDNAIVSGIIVTMQSERGIKRWLTSRAIVYAGPLWTGDSDINGFLSFLNERLGRKAIYLEFRNYMNLSNYQDFFHASGYEFLPYLNYVLPLENRSLDEILAQMNYNRRREIRISFEQGAKVSEAECEQEIIAGYEILKDLYVHRVKLPLPALSFFLEMVKKTMARVLIVKHNERVIGASFCLFNRNGIYTWYYCGKRDYHKKIFPTHLAIVGTIEFGLRHGVKSLDFMGAGLKGQEYGVRKYKEEFAGQLVEFGRYRKIYAPWRFRMGVWAIQQMQKMKKK